MNRRVLIWGALAIVLAVVVASGGAALMRGKAPAAPFSLSDPGDFGEVPAFTLTDRSGRTVSRDDLLGRFWVADFIFTRCTGVCPLLTARMAALGAALAREPGGDQVRFVSFSVDPSHDTPEVLRDHAMEAAASIPPERWLFLTGPSKQIYRLVRDGFRLSVAEREPEPGVAGDLITHSDRFVLVDPDGKIRGYYRGADEESVDKLRGDLLGMMTGRPR